jgi:hypothetical protein
MFHRVPPNPDDSRLHATLATSVCSVMFNVHLALLKQNTASASFDIRERSRLQQISATSMLLSFAGAAHGCTLPACIAREGGALLDLRTMLHHALMRDLPGTSARRPQACHCDAAAKRVQIDHLQL